MTDAWENEGGMAPLGEALGKIGKISREQAELTQQPSAYNDKTVVVGVPSRDEPCAEPGKKYRAGVVGELGYVVGAEEGTTVPRTKDTGPLLGIATTKELLEELMIRGQEAPREYISYRATLLGFTHGMLDWGKSDEGKELLGRKRNDAQA